MARVGLLGGTFDPPHLGHLVVAECARVELDLDEVRWLVAGDPWMKDSVSPAEDRVAMAEAATGGTGFTVDDREVERQGPTYTVDTLTELHREEPDNDWWFLLGADAAAELGAWERIEEALALATFVVVTRPGHATELEDRFVDRVRRLPVPAIEVSSTDLRARYASDSATRFLVPDAVDGYVRRRGLYRAADG